MTDNTSETEQVAELFHQVADLDRRAREQLYRERGVSDTVRAEVESLLGEQPHSAFSERALGVGVRSFAGASVAWASGEEVGDYEIVGEVARGGMGVVFEAKQRPLGRRVAIKVVPPSQFSDASDLDRFRAETEAIARLEHSGIVPVYEVAEHDGMPFYSMPFLGGGSLKELEVPLDARRAAELVAEIGDAVHYAHTQNIVHRDLKPANVLLTDSLQPKVSDFGLAKDVGEDSEDLTRTGAVLGTPGFMAPEQARGDGDAVGLLADVYGLGGILFYLLTGRAPIEGQNLVETLHNVVYQDAPDARRLRPGLSADLASICAKALEKEPARRYGSAASLAADLRRFLTGEPTEARPLRAGQRFVRWCRRRPAVAALMAVAVISLIGGIATATLYGIETANKAAELATANDSLREKNEALIAAQADAEAFSTFLIEDVLVAARTVDHGGRPGRGTTVQEALVAAIPKVAKRFEGRPLAEARARNEIGITLRHVQQREKAIEQLRIALDIRRRELGAEAGETLRTWNSLGTAYFDVKKYEEAATEFEGLIEAAERQQHYVVRFALRNLSRCYEKMDRYEDSIRVLAKGAEVADGDDRTMFLANLAAAQATVGRFDDARRSVEGVDEMLRSGGKLSLWEFDTIDLALLDCFLAMRDMVNVNDTGRRLLKRSVEKHGPKARMTTGTARKLAFLEGYELDLDLELQAVEILIAGNGDKDSLTAREFQIRAARLQLRAGDADAARVRAQRAFGWWAAAGLNLPETFAAEAVLCEMLLESWNRDEARQHLQPRSELLRQLVKETEEPEQLAAYRAALEQFDALLERL